MIRAGWFLALLLALSASFAHAQTLEPTVANGATADLTGVNGMCQRVTNTCGATVMIPTKTTSEWTAYYGGAKPACVATSSTCSCTSPWSTTVNSGSSVTAYNTNLGAPSCPSESRTCTNGTLSGTYTYQSCLLGCGTQTVSWSNCDASSGATLTSGSGRTITNTTAGYTGTRNITCTNGVISQSGGSCTATCGGYSYGGYCYRFGATANQSCDTVCASYGGCNATGTAAIGSSGSNAACQAVVNGLGGGGTVTNISGGAAVGCALVIIGQTAAYRRTTSPATTCAAQQGATRRYCACAN